MKKNGKFTFVGNVEGRDLFNDKADVIVCDGFTGNIVLKAVESAFSLIQQNGVSVKGIEKYNYENYGGAPILGVNAPIVIGHGISKAKAIMNMLSLTKDIIDSNLISKIKTAFN